jgi:hypothetical protein
VLKNVCTYGSILVVMHLIRDIVQTIDIELNFKPFPLLENGSSSLNSQISKLCEFDANGEYESAIELAHELMMLGLQGLRYLQT